MVLQLEAHENYGKANDNGQPGGPARPSGGVGRASGSAAPRGINNVHSLFDNSTLHCHLCSVLLRHRMC